MTVQGSPAVARHRLRLALRKAREAKELTQGEVAASLDWSLSKLQRIEGGENSISTTDTRALLQVLGITEAAVVDQLVDEARLARKRNTWDDPRYREHLTDATRELIQFDREARIIRTYQITLVPGPLQTPALAEAVFRLWGGELTEEAFAIRLEVRLQRRQNVFDRPNPPDYRFLMDESVLHRPIGGPAVFAEQLRSLVGDADNGRVRMRITPFTAGPVAGVNPFSLLSMDDDDEDVLLYRENHLVDEIGQSPERVARHLAMFESFWGQSYSEAESRQLVLDRAKSLESRTHEEQTKRSP